MQNKEYRAIQLKNPWVEDYATREAYRALRTNLMFCGRDKKVIAITSCIPNEGKSTISMGIAKSLSDLGKKVLLIDADMRKSSIQEIWTEESELDGLAQYLSGQIERKQAIYVTQYPGFHIMFCGYYPPNPVELLDTEVFRQFLEEVREEYDYILIDNPPIAMVIDAAVVSRFCDAAILVAAAGRISARLARSCKAQIEKSGCPILGVVLNDTERRRNVYYRKSAHRLYYNNTNE